MKRVLVISAHPDDETYGVAGTICRHVKEADLVEVIIMTDGVGARHEHAEPQRNAAIEACSILGVRNLHFGNLPDQRLDSLPLLEVIDPIYKLVKSFRPDIVYTHHGGDVNQDHRVIFDASMVAVRPFGSNPVSEVYSYEVSSSTEWAPPLPHWTFYPNSFVDIEEFMEIKLKAIEAYTKTFISEVPPFPHPRSKEAVVIKTQSVAIAVGMKYAEAFMLIRKLVK